MIKQPQVMLQPDAEGETSTQFIIEPLADFVRQLLASLHQLNEEVKLLNLSIKAQAAEAGDANAINEYKLALQAVYGITIDDDEIAANFEALKNYQEALDLFAQFLETTYFPDGTSMVDKYRFFQEVMGQITIYRASDRHKDSSETAFGYTVGHTIWDMFTISGTRRQSHMSADNFVHELAHSFLTGSGLGNWPIAPLAIDRTLVNAMEAAMGSGTVRINPSSDPNEVVADFILNLALGNVSFDDVPGSEELFQDSIFNAILANTPPEEIAQLLGIDYSPFEATYIDNREEPQPLNTRFAMTDADLVNLNNSSLDNRPFFSYQSQESVIILGRTRDALRDTGLVDEYWVYVYKYNEYHQYSSVRADTLMIDGQRLSDLIASGDVSIEEIEIIEGAALNPYHPRR